MDSGKKNQQIILHDVVHPLLLLTNTGLLKNCFFGNI